MGQILIKKGVDLGTVLAPAGARILDTLKQLVPGYEFDVTITSGRDGEHSGPHDPHKTGEAFDLRTNTLTDAQRSRLINDLKDALYKEPRRFYVLWENPGKPNAHCHVQRRAGTTYSITDYLQNL